jgi:hypothetical protein
MGSLPLLIHREKPYWPGQSSTSAVFISRHGSAYAAAFMRKQRGLSRISMLLWAHSYLQKREDSFSQRQTGWSAVTMRQLSHCRSAHKRVSASKQQTPEMPHIHAQIAPLPRRPNRTYFSDSIPLFFIGCNRSGFWVARESEGRSGGLFLFRQSAARFARKKSSPTGCAIMLVERPIELDLPNQGNRVLEPIGTIVGVIRRHAPFVTGLIGMVIAAWRKVDAQISHALADHYRNREAIEKDLLRNREAIENDLFRGEYILVSKNDDDLPILSQAESKTSRKYGTRK